MRPPDADDPTTPWVTYALLTVNIAVALFVTGVLPPNVEAIESLAWSREAMADGEWHRLATSMFVHAGLLHLGFNMIALFSFASLEEELGSGVFALIYFASGVGGGLLHVATTEIPGVGASGAIFGILGVILVLAPRLELSLLGLPVPAIFALMLYLSVVLLVPSFSELLPIAHWAHLGGMFTGMAMGAALEPERALDHLGYIVLIFAGTLVLVTALRDLPFGEIPAIFRRDGIPGLLAETWLVWLALLGIVLTLEALRRKEGQGQEAERE